MKFYRPGLVAVMGLVMAYGPALQAASIFADPQLEAAVRAALNRPNGDLSTNDLLELTSLRADVYGITDLSGLEAAANLIDLRLEVNNLSNLAALKRLPQLTRLDLSYNHLRDVSFLSGLTNLTSLFLAGNLLETVPALEHMPRLVELALSHNHITDPTRLRELVSLQYLNMTGNPLCSLGSLCGLTNLAQLALGELSMTNVDELSCLSNLLGLELYNNQVTDVTPLVSLTHLQRLDLSANPVTDFAPLAALTSLTDLSLREASLIDLGWLAEMRGLGVLDLSQNSIADVSPLAGLPNLWLLNLSQNPLTNYSALASIPKLQTLYVEGNSISNLSFASKLSALTGISMGGNYIADLSPVAGLTNLLWIQADINLLTDISALRDLPQLQSVTLSQNLLDLATGSSSMGTIQTLQSNGVSVYYQPQLVPPQFLVKSPWLVAAGQKSWLPITASDGVVSWLHPITVVPHSSNQQLLPEAGLVIRHSDDLDLWDVAVTPAKDQIGTAVLTLAATNYAGLWTNITIQVQVVQPVPFNGESLDSQLSWTTAGVPAWFSETSVSHDGIGAVQSGAQDSWLQTTVGGPGTLRFWWKLESDYFYANSEFTAVSLDSNLRGWQYLPRGGEAWQQALVALPPGNWRLQWSPSWDNWSYGGVNTLWLDQVSFVPGSPGCWIEPRFYDAGGEHVFALHGVPGRSYSVEFSDDLLNWMPLAQVQCVNFETEFRDWRQAGAARFYRAKAVPQ